MGYIQSIGLQRVRHDRSNLARTHTLSFVFYLVLSFVLDWKISVFLMPRINLNSLNRSYSQDLNYKPRGQLLTSAGPGSHNGLNRRTHSCESFVFICLLVAFLFLSLSLRYICLLVPAKRQAPEIRGAWSSWRWSSFFLMFIILRT